MKHLIIITLLLMGCTKEVVRTETKIVEPKKRLLRFTCELERIGGDTMNWIHYHYDKKDRLDSVTYHINATAGKWHWQTIRYEYLDVDHRKATYHSPEYTYKTYFIETLDFEGNIIDRREYYIEDNAPESRFVHGYN
jgi:hypothetical protein